MTDMSRDESNSESRGIYVIRSAEGPRSEAVARPSEAEVRRDVGNLLRAAGLRNSSPRTRQAPHQ